ncbi:MAG: hypothetical protein ACK50U_18420 [Acidobacteriota bacterium]
MRRNFPPDFAVKAIQRPSREYAQHSPCGQHQPSPLKVLPKTALLLESDSWSGKTILEKLSHVSQLDLLADT